MTHVLSCLLYSQHSLIETVEAWVYPEIKILISYQLSSLFHSYSHYLGLKRERCLSVFWEVVACFELFSELLAL